jgi:hypothetical protein
MLEIQKFLRAAVAPPYCGLYDLEKKYQIKSKRHPVYPNLVLLKYSQTESPMHERIVQECRGIILDEQDDWRIVSRAFDKFFNHGEGHAAPIDWASARVQEKVDGSLCVLYPYDGKWHVATSGSPDAGGNVSSLNKELTFQQMFWMTLCADTLPSPTCNICFYFEISGPLNRVVVQHKEISLTLLGARDLLTQYEFSADEFVGNGLFGDRFTGVNRIKSFALQSFDEIAATFAHMNPLQQEGYVIVDKDFHRVKVKHPGYVALHHAKGGLSRKAFIEIARTNEVSEVEVAFPEFKPYIEETKERYERLVAEVEADYWRLQDIVEQKDFARHAVVTRCASALFAVRAKKAPSVKEFFREYRVDSLMGLLGYKDNDIPTVEVA